MLPTLALIATLALKTEPTARLDQNIIVATSKAPSFDRDVILPLRQIQAQEAADEAKRVAEEARRQEEIRLAEERDRAATLARMQPSGAYANTYTAGQCTWYVASRIQVPQFMGNATNWSAGLLSAGWRTGLPRAGAVGVSHLGWAGHVVVVERVVGGMVLVSEMNYNGPYSVDTRLAPIYEFEYYYQ